MARRPGNAALAGDNAASCTTVLPNVVRLAVSCNQLIAPGGWRAGARVAERVAAAFARGQACVRVAEIRMRMQGVEPLTAPADATQARKHAQQSGRDQARSSQAKPMQHRGGQSGVLGL